MGDLSTAAIVRTDLTGRIYPQGEVLPPQAAEIQPLAAPGLAASGTPLDEFRPGDPLFETAQEALGYKQASRSPATKRAYESDFRLFEEWCGQAELASLPATISTIDLYMTQLATSGAKVATISRKLAAISFRHKENQLPSPCSMKADRELAQVWAGICKTTGIKQESKAAVTLKLIRRMLDIEEGGPLTASRDRALILIGFAGGLRRSELAGIRGSNTSSHTPGGSQSRFPSRRPIRRGREGKSRSPAAASSRTRRLRNVPARSGRSTSGCARPA
jgi:integrase